MKRAALVGAILVLTATAAWAQAPADECGRQRRPPGAGRGLMPIDVVARRLATELNLTPEQQTKFDEIVAKYRAAADEQQVQRGDAQELGRQLREARASGDTQRLTELREQSRARGEARQKLLAGLVNEVKPLLTAEQATKLDAARERLLTRSAAGRGLAQDAELIWRLPDELDLNDAQREQFDKLVSQTRQHGEEQRAKWRELQPALEELRQARQSGDEAKVQELQAKVDAQRPAPPDWSAFYTQLETILTAEQKATLGTLRAEGAEPDATPGDVRQVLRAARQLDLNKEQRERLQAIAKEAQAAARQHRDDQAGASELAARVKTQVVGLLDVEQKAEFERRLERGAGPGRGGPGRPGRGPM